MSRSDIRQFPRDKLFINTYNLSFKIAEIFVVFFFVLFFLCIYWQIIKYHISKIIKIAFKQILIINFSESKSKDIKQRMLQKVYSSLMFVVL